MLNKISRRNIRWPTQIGENDFIAHPYFLQPILAVNRAMSSALIGPISGLVAWQQTWNEKYKNNGHTDRFVSCSLNKPVMQLIHAPLNVEKTTFLSSLTMIQICQPYRTHMH